MIQILPHTPGYKSFTVYLKCHPERREGSLSAMIARGQLLRNSLCKLLLLVAILGGGIMNVVAQKNVTGVVTDQHTKIALVGATIFVKGTTRGVLTDADGRFSILANEGDVLAVSHHTYEGVEATIGKGNFFKFKLVPNFSLQNGITLGYSRHRKEDLTGAVSVVDPEDLLAMPTGNIVNQLQGRASGISVTQDGRPGSPSKLRVRGFGSFLNNDPLYVIDGVPTQDISTLNPNDIATISILKDAGAAANYGSRAANGVIVLTTKEGGGPLSVNYQGYVGTQIAGTGSSHLLDTKGYADLQWLVYENDNKNEIHPIYGPSPAAGGTQPQFPDWAGNTNWWEETTNNALITNHDVSLSGGGANSRFYVGVNYFDQQGILHETWTKRLSARFNSSFNIKDRITIGENFTVIHTSNGQNIANTGEESPISEIFRAQSIIPVRVNDSISGISHDYEAGQWGGTGIARNLGNSNNPLATQTRNADDRRLNIRLLGSGYIDVKLMKGLNFRTTLGGNLSANYLTDYTAATYENLENVTVASFSEGAGYVGDWVLSNTLTFERKIGRHNLLLVGGYEALKYGMGRNILGNTEGYLSDAVEFRTLTNGSFINGLNSYISNPTSIISNFFSVDYTYKNKYFLRSSIRRDGVSRFSKNNRYGTFPSVTAGWVLSEERFWKKNALISSLKVRGGYGTLGNQWAIAPQAAFYSFGGSMGTSSYDINGTGNSAVQGLRPLTLGSQDIKWETNVTTNIGVDASLFKNRIGVVFDWYTREHTDLLFNPELPGTAGAATAPFVNIAEMKNTGIDLQVIYREKLGTDFRIEGSLVFTKYQNEIVKVSEGDEFFNWGETRIGTLTRNQIGHSMSSFYGYEVVGLFQSTEEIESAPPQAGAAPGFLRYADTNEDGKITSDDRTFIGDPNPDFTYGVNLSLNYLNFDLSAFIYGSQGNEIFNYNKWWTDFWPSFQGQKSTALLNDSWTPDRTDATVPKASNVSNFSTNTQVNSYYIEEGSFVRLKSLQIGYTIPHYFARRFGLSNARVYMQGTNLVTLTKYSGLDPEIGSSGTSDDRAFGIDYGNFPISKQYLFGVNLSF